ncbi:MAG TPA: MmcQ/YjbR family DNA-binding protein [Propionibacteriaceae bacterium]|nr:MmcQ/YjbR family DNA-binding protein [Propionibacteriaceae bacterium]
MIDWLTYCLAKPGAWQDEPWEGDVVVKVADKIFAFIGAVARDDAAPAGIGLKCGDREAADVWLERYPDSATRSAYIGQHGWNNFRLDGTIPDDEIAELIDTSYELVVAKLPKAKRPGV